MKKEIIIITAFLLFGAVLFYLNFDSITGQAILDTSQNDDILDYNSKLLDYMQIRLEITLNPSNFNRNGFQLDVFLRDTYSDLTKAKGLKEKLISEKPPIKYQEAHLSLINSTQFLINSLEIAIEGASQQDESKLNWAVYYMNLSNNEFDRASELIRKI